MTVVINGDGVVDVGGNSSSAAKVRLYEDSDNGTNYIDLLAPASVASDRTITLPDETTTLVGTDATQTLTNKSIVATQLTGTIAAARLPAGSVLQVIQTVKTSLFSLATEDSWTDVTGVSVSITPSSASNKILLFVSGEYSGSSNDGFAYLRILRGATSIAIGDSRGSSNRVTMSAALRNDGGNSSNISRSFGCHILDSPATTSSVTYKLQMLGTNNQPFCVGGSFDASDDNRSSVPTFITAMEIAG